MIGSFWRVGVVRIGILALLILAIQACGSLDSSRSTASGRTSASPTSQRSAATAKPRATPRPTVKPTSKPAAKPTAKPTVKPTAMPTSKPTAVPISNSGLPLILAQDLPKEGRATLALILKGGPFPYERDGVTFQNRERILPRQPNNYYREYTVPTPGENDRGARRLVVGREGDIYYTDDHYDSFFEVAQ